LASAKAAGFEQNFDLAFKTHLKNRILVQDRSGTELFQDNWIPHRFYYVKGRRPRCGISRLVLNNL
jgi:hypothetical protein